MTADRPFCWRTKTTNICEMPFPVPQNSTFLTRYLSPLARICFSLTSDCVLALQKRIFEFGGPLQTLQTVVFLTGLKI